MNKVLKYILPFLFSICLGINSYAQEDWEDQGEIENAQIVVEKNKKIELPKANRKFEKIDKLEDKEINTSQKFDYLKPSLLGLNQISPRLKILKIKSEPQKPMFGNYVEAGFGNYVTPYLNAYFNSTRNSKYAYGTHINHISSKNGPVEYSGMSNSEIGINGDYFLSNATVRGNLKFNNQAFRYYGFNPDSVEINDEKDIKQNLNTISGLVGVDGKANNFSYDLNGVFSALSGKDTFSDINLGYIAKTEYELADNSSILLNSDLIIENAKQDTFEANRTYFTANPQYKFLHEGINITVGLNTAYDNDVINGESGKFHIYPNVFLNYPLFINELNVFAGVTGGLERNSFSSLISQNQWFVMSENLVFNNNKKIDFFGGLKGNFVQKLGYKAQLSFKNYNNLHFFVNHPLDSTQFTVVSDSGNTSVVTLNGEMSYEISEKLTSSINLTYNSYSLSTLDEAFHRPNLILAINSSYNIQNKVTLKGQLNYISGLKGYSLGKSEIVELNEIIDLNFGLDYKLSNNFSTFVMLNNVLASNYSYYLNYPNKRFNAILGLSYSF